MVKCECCGRAFFGIHVKCPECGNDVFAESLKIKYERKLYDENIGIMCKNCVYCRRENGAGAVSFYCIKNLDYKSCITTFKIVDLEDSCSKFVYYKDAGKRL